MVLNLTEMYIEGADLPYEDDVQVIAEVLGDPERIDEAVMLLASYDANTIVVDLEEQHFADLQAEMPNSKLAMGYID